MFFVQRYVLPSITKAPSTRLQILQNPQRFLSGHGYRSHARIRCIRLTNPQGFESHYVSRYAWTVIPDIFLSGDVTKATPVLCCEYCIQYDNLDACSVTDTPRLNPDTCLIRLNGHIRFESEKKNLQIQKYPDTCGVGQKSQVTTLL